MHKSKLLLLLAPLLATACAVGPSYHQPRLPVEASGAFQTKSADFDTTAALPDDWWQLYRDPALDALIAEAFAANTDLRVASANLVKARAVLTEARTGRLPSTDISGAPASSASVAMGLASRKAGLATASTLSSWIFIACSPGQLPSP